MPNRRKKEDSLTNQEEQLPASVQLNLMAAFRQGPLPPPAEMEKYEILYPGATKSLFENLIKQSEHRMEIERKVIVEDNKRANRGQILSFASTILLTGVAVGLFISGKDALGISAIIAAVAPTISAFITSSITRSRERQDKRQQINS